ncbi:GH92 family glycosyl hydrolase [Dyella sp.]|uniref:GH92 family glycosyl hydrolase n=1 Tax=Dyella sp. TaxID=1869338 RepID=UPI002ED27737
MGKHGSFRRAVTARMQVRGKALCAGIALALSAAMPVLAHEANHAGVAFFSSLEAHQPSLAGEAAEGLRVSVVDGPSKEEVLTSKPGAGFTGTHALRYDGDAVTTQGARRVVVFKPSSVKIDAGMHLSYMLLPVMQKDDSTAPAQHVAIDLLFNDGSRLSSLAATDQYRTAATATAQGEARLWHGNQWNRVDIDVGRVANGRKLAAIELVTDAPAGSEAFHGYIDDIRLGASIAPGDALAPHEYVDTRRGSFANGHFSRGNNFPAVTVPHGFNFWTVTTAAGSDWIYQYQERNDQDNRPRIQAFSLSHEPSPWMGDRQTFQVMPAMAGSGAPELDRAKRAMSFSHDNEIARADLYQVKFDNGLVARMTPTDHAAMMQFTFTGKRSQLVFDNRNDKGGIELDPQRGVISGYSDVASQLSTGATRLFFYAVFDQPVTESGRITGQGRDHVAAWYGFDTHKSRTVTMRMATSLISVDQARHNLELELPQGVTFESVQTAAAANWDGLLRTVEIPGADGRDKTVLYSNLYRLFMYPNEAFENVGSPATPDYRYASPFSSHEGDDTPTHTGARVLSGKPYVNNGLWDTYRTAWPAYTLLTPHDAGEMIDGFVQQYRDGGWIARWSSPGYADLMVGTSADVAFADAWSKGISNFDVLSFYKAALKDATVVSDVRGAGRKGVERSIFNGYTDNGTDEGLSWSMAGYLNDFGIAELAQNLADHPVPGDTYASYADDARYLRNRARNYVRLFNKEAGFFIGRKPDGQWRIDAKDFDPYAWGGDYTETNAWNMAFDGGVQDGQGLANLYGGLDGLASKLDAFFGAPTYFHVGEYGGVIHEMLEARDVRMGQYGHSNQPSHHILYMYDVAGQPWKTQDKVRDALTRLYIGSDIGQGYPGDEDNGEMSGWWLFSAAGFYPLRAGTSTYAIGAPYFPHMVIRSTSGSIITIDAPAVSDKNRYIQGVTLNGKPYDKTWIAQQDLDNAHLVFDMGPSPSHWGTGPDARLPSLTQGNDTPSPMSDLADQAGAQVSIDGDATAAKAISDNTSDTEATLGEIPVRLRLPSAQAVQMYTLTSSAKSGNDPASWEVLGSNDGKRWTLLDRRHDEQFAWRRQTRAFGIAHPGKYRYYRWRALGTGDVTVAEMEWLGNP